MSRLVLGLDCGLTVTKAVLFDETARAHATASARVAQKSPKPRWVLRQRRRAGCTKGTEAFEKVWLKDDLITAAAVYFLTETGGTSSRYYKECVLNPWEPSHDRFPVVGAPTAVSIYPGEIFKPPKKWTEKYFNLQQYRVHDAGGHFAPREAPDLFLDDVRTFFARFR